MSLLIREVIPRPLFFLCLNSDFTTEVKEMEKRANNFKDMTGMTFGELTVIEIDERKTKEYNRGIYWKCKCSCGKEKSIWGSHLRNGSIVTCGNRSIHNRSKNNPNWRGGVTPEIQSARTSKEYAEWRNKVYAMDHYTCQCCLRNKNIKKEAHHIYNFSDHKDLRYDPIWGVTLCYECHSMYEPGSFHHTYGTRNNTPEQLETYINNKRKQLGILIPFKIDEYIKQKKTHRLDNWLESINIDPADPDWSESLLFQPKEETDEQI